VHCDPIRAVAILKHFEIAVVDDRLFGAVGIGAIRARRSDRDSYGECDDGDGADC